MRILFFILVFFIGVSCFSQDLGTGFYMVDESRKGILVQEMDNGTDTYVHPNAILVLNDVERMRVDYMENPPSHLIAFELNQKAAERFKSFTESYTPMSMVLVIDEKVVSNAALNWPITNGRFTLSGFDEKTAKAVLNRLSAE